MSIPDQDQLLRQLADTFINVANDHNETQDNNIVNTAFMYSAARFCAFVAASKALSLEDFQEKQLQGIDFFTAEFKQMLESNMRNYEKEFEKTEQLPYAKYMKKH